MTARNGEQVERRLGQTSLYDPTLDLAVVNDEGTVAGYALFWHDPLTGVGLLEPMRVEEEFGTEISDEDAERIRTVGDAVEYIDERNT